MGDLELWSSVVGFGMPLGIAFLNQSRWSKPLRAIVAFTLCLLAAFITVYLRGEFTVVNLVHSALFVFVTAIATYHLWWRPSTIAPGVEAATSSR